MTEHTSHTAGADFFGFSNSTKRKSPRDQGRADAKGWFDCLLAACPKCTTKIDTSWSILLPKQRGGTSCHTQHLCLLHLRAQKKTSATCHGGMSRGRTGSQAATPPLPPVTKNLQAQNTDCQPRRPSILETTRPLTHRMPARPPGLNASTDCCRCRRRHQILALPTCSRLSSTRILRCFRG